MVTEPTLVLLGRIVVVDLLSDAFAFAKVAGQIFLLLLVVVAEQLLPVVWIHVLLLLDDLPLHLLLHMDTHKGNDVVMFTLMFQSKYKVKIRNLHYIPQILYEEFSNTIILRQIHFALSCQ